jgi:hypothetical protein
LNVRRTSHSSSGAGSAITASTSDRDTAHHGPSWPSTVEDGRVELAQRAGSASASIATIFSLAGLATGPEPVPAPGSGGIPITEIAGPREENLVDMAIQLAARRGDPVRIEGVSNPADPDRDLYETGGNLSSANGH